MGGNNGKVWSGSLVTHPHTYYVRSVRALASEACSPMPHWREDVRLFLCEYMGWSALSLFIAKRLWSSRFSVVIPNSEVLFNVSPSSVLMIQACAHSCQAVFISLSCATIYSCYVGEAEATIRDVFARVRMLPASSARATRTFERLINRFVGRFVFCWHLVMIGRSGASGGTRDHLSGRDRGHRRQARFRLGSAGLMRGEEARGGRGEEEKGRAGVGCCGTPLLFGDIPCLRCCCSGISSLFCLLFSEWPATFLMRFCGKEGGRGEGRRTSLPASAPFRSTTLPACPSTLSSALLLPDEGGAGVSERVLSTLLNEMDGVVQAEDVLVVVCLMVS